MNLRRRISSPKLRAQHCIGSTEHFDRAQIWHQNHYRSAQPMSQMGQKPALPRGSIAVRSTPVNGHSTRRGTYWTGRLHDHSDEVASAYHSSPFFTPTISLAKIIFKPSPLTIFLQVAKFPAASRQSGCFDQPAPTSWPGLSP